MVKRGECLLEDRCNICIDKPIFKNLLNSKELMVRVEGDRFPFKIKDLSLNPYSLDNKTNAVRISGSIVDVNIASGRRCVYGIIDDNNRIILTMLLGEEKFITNGAVYSAVDNCIRFSYANKGKNCLGSISLH